MGGHAYATHDMDSGCRGNRAGGIQRCHGPGHRQPPRSKAAPTPNSSAGMGAADTAAAAIMAVNMAGTAVVTMAVITVAIADMVTVAITDTMAIATPDTIDLITTRSIGRPSSIRAPMPITMADRITTRATIMARTITTTAQPMVRVNRWQCR